MIRQPRTSQPQGSVSIDTSHPLARGLVAVLDPSRPALNVAGGVFTASNYKNTAGVAGTALSALSSGSPVISSSLNLSGDRTVLIYGTPKSSVTKVWMTSSTSAGVAYWFGINNSKWSIGGLVESTRTHNFASVSCGVATKRGSTHSVYFNGTLENSGTNAMADGSGISFLGFGTTANFEVTEDRGAANLIAVWNRALSDAEIKSLSDNPWQIFQPTNRAIWVPVAAAGGSPYTLTADTANVAIAGTATGLAFNRTIIAEAASLAINGNATGLAFNRVLTADTANLALTGNAATLTYTPIGGPTYTLTADTANTAITGADAGLAFNRKLIADAANLPISGTDAGLARGYTLAADNGALGISGSDAALIAVRKLIADSYALAVAGADAALTYTPLTLPTIGRPASDTSNTGWTASTGSDLYAMLDEVTPSDADYISASSVGAVCKMALGTTAYPGTASQVLKYRASSSTGNSVIVRLKEGVTTIRAETQLLTSVDTEYSITLTSGEIAAITSGSLSVELESA